MPKVLMNGQTAFQFYIVDNIDLKIIVITCLTYTHPKQLTS